MRKIKNIIGSAVMAIALGCSSMMTSCTDYLTIYPTNSVILENYWKTAEDVNAILATCYSSMANSDVIKRLMIWGEVRADNMVPRATASTELKYINEANLLETNSYYNWEHFYRTINYCNILLKYAPGVMDEDPDFTQGDLDVIMGEAYALRALCHFTLVRAFRNIPMNLEAMDADDQPMVYPQCSPYEVLDSVAADLDRAAVLCMKTGGWSDDAKNVARITKDAVYAMMADVNLWRAAFAKYAQLAPDDELTVPENYAPAHDEKYYCTLAIENCDSVLVSMRRQLFKKYEDERKTMTGLDTILNPYFLCWNDASEKGYPTVYDEIFLDKKRTRDGYMTPNEIIFKLDFNSSNKNSAVDGFYGYDANSGTYTLPSKAPIASGLYEDSDSRFYSYTSAVSGANQSSDKDVYTIAKYVSKTADRGKDKKKIEYWGSGNCQSDWIFYRKTDVLLMKAAALAYRYGSATTTEQEDHNEAFKIVKYVNLRNLTNIKADSLESKECTSVDALRKLVLDERLRELTFEGKRWFDLVQKALWENSTTGVLDLVVKKLDSNAGAVQSKMSTIHTFFSPIYESELILNPLLKQNPVFERSSSSEMK